VHTIRLAGPWEFAGPIKESSSRDHLEWSRVKLPATWEECCGDACGRVLFRRAFNQPTNLTDEQIRIAIPATGCNGTVRLNGELLGELSGDVQRFPVSRLELRNLLELELVSEDSTAANGLTSPVLLELVPA